MATQNLTISKQTMDSLIAACDTLLPSTDPPSFSDEAILSFYRNSASMAGTPDVIAELLSGGFHHPAIWMFRCAMWLLSTRIGTLAICGTSSLSCSFPYLHTFPELEQEKREAILLGWSLSSLHIYRMLFQCLKYLTMRVHFAHLDQHNRNPSWPALGYCGPDPDFTQQDCVGVGPLHDAVLDMGKMDACISAKLQDKGFKAPSTDSSGKLTLRCDAVVVGSGAGGSVVAGVLASKGYKVLVLEKGGYFARKGLSLLEGPTAKAMYEGGGFIATDDLRVLLLAGATVGGGTTINWSASIRTPSHVRKEWCDELGLELFTSNTYDAALDAVCGRMAVQSAVETEGFNNEILRKGCISLGYLPIDVPCNAPPDHYCGWCHLGCKDGKKKGCIETWLSDLADSGNGVILTGCRAIQVLQSDGSAVGVLVKCSKQVFEVEADVTVIACGALNTPGLLKRSGLRNRNIGRHLRLHPCVMAWGYFPGDHWPGKEKRSYEGGILTAMTTVEEADVDGDGYGAILQTPSLHPSLFATVTPWVSAGDFRTRMRRFARVAHVFALVREKASSGTVEYPRTVDYRMDGRDEMRLGLGLGAALRVLAAAGAEEVGTVHGEGRRFRVREGGDELGFEEFVREESGRRLRTAPVNSAHQMGSCRMAADPAAGAVRPDGETWEVGGLFVADGSVFPTAIGVNPMVTIQAIAYCTAQSILRRLESKNGRV